MTDAQDKKPGIYLGMKFNLNGRDLTLAPKTPVNQISTKGLELELPDTIFLGKFGEMGNKLINSFIPDNPDKNKVDIKNLTTGIDAVDTVIKKINSAELSLSRFHTKIYPEELVKNEDGTKYLPKNDNDENKNDIEKINAQTSIEKLTVPEKELLKKVKKKNIKPTEYTVALAATWSEPPAEQQPNIGGFDMTLQGLVVMLSNEEQESNLIEMIEEATAEAQKILAPGRDLDALKLKAQEKLEDKLNKAQEKKNKLQETQEKIETIESNITLIKNSEKALKKQKIDIPSIDNTFKNKVADAKTTVETALTKAETALTKARKDLSEFFKDNNVEELDPKIKALFEDNNLSKIDRAVAAINANPDAVTPANPDAAINANPDAVTPANPDAVTPANPDQTK